MRRAPCGSSSRRGEGYFPGSGAKAAKTSLAAWSASPFDLGGAADKPVHPAARTRNRMVEPPAVFPAECRQRWWHARRRGAIRPGVARDVDGGTACGVSGEGVAPLAAVDRGAGSALSPGVSPPPPHATDASNETATGTRPGTFSSPLLVRGSGAADGGCGWDVSKLPPTRRRAQAQSVSDFSSRSVRSRSTISVTGTAPTSPPPRTRTAAAFASASRSPTTSM